MAKKFKDEPAQEYGVPDLSITLQAYIAKYAPDILSQTEIMQGNTALTFFTGLFQPAQPGEGKRQLKNSVDWPYANRVINFARVFLRLNDREKSYIIKTSQAGIWWRGDDIQNFRRIVEETLNYRRLSEPEKEAYRHRIMAKAKALAARYAPASA